MKNENGLEFYKVDIFVESCGSFGCLSHSYSAIVAAKNKKDAKEIVDLPYNSMVEKVEKFKLPTLEKKKNGFIVC